MRDEERRDVSGSAIRLLAAVGVAAALGSTTAAGAPASATRSIGSAAAYAIRVVLPGGGGVGTPAVAAPRDSVSTEAAFSYPEDGSIVSTGFATASASASIGASARTQASSQVSSLSFFGGEVTVASVSARARANATAKSASGDTAGSRVSGLAVLGQPVRGGRAALGDWGYAEASTGSAAASGSESTNGYRAAVTALVIHVTSAHGGLPAGSQIVVGHADADAQADKPAPVEQATPTPTPRRTPAPTATPTVAPVRTATPTPRPVVKRPRPPEPQRRPARPPQVRTAPPTIVPRLTPKGYVFPVYGPSSWTDTFGAPRPNPTVGWHHGEDIFAPLGAPVLAVNDGTVFSVGWNTLGGNRLWLRDEQGNEFYYAHLSAFSPLAVNGARVQAGDVLGFVGNTGDAAGTPYHLHFEIHPAALLALGYDGVVNPAPYLRAWQHLEDIEFPTAARKAVVAAARAARSAGAPPWTPGGAAWAPRVAATSAVPPPGAILLQASDISQASGLHPRSLIRALAALTRGEGDGALVLQNGGRGG